MDGTLDEDGRQVAPGPPPAGPPQLGQPGFSRGPAAFVGRPARPVGLPPGPPPMGWSVPPIGGGVLPPRRRSSGVGRMVLSVVLLMVGFIGGKIAFDAAFDRLVDRDVPPARHATAEIDEPSERTAVVYRDGGVTLTMQEEPEREVQDAPTADGGSIELTAFVADLGGVAEMAYVAELPPGFVMVDPTAAFQGFVEALEDGSVGEIAEVEVAGRPGLSAPVEMTIEGKRGSGYLAVVNTDRHMAGVAMISLTGDDQQLLEQFMILVDSLEVT